ncbi:hypothetical protein ACTL6U_16265 [Rhodovibrionaceae bacterium A322]
MPWALPERDEDRLALAKGYPFEAPDQSFLFHLPIGKAVDRKVGGRPVGEPASEPTLTLLNSLDAEQLRGRHAVLGHGSNRAPSQLQRKFAGPEFQRQLGAAPELADQVIPVTYIWLEDHDVVYSAHVTRYGSIASNLTHHKGCRVRVAVTWLTDLQLQRMHETEGPNYPYGRLAGARWQSDLPLAGADENSIPLQVYKSQYGCLPGPDGPALSMAAVRAEGRPGRSAGQEAALALVQQRHHPDEDLDSHILANIADSDRRTRLIAALAKEALPASLPQFQGL